MIEKKLRHLCRRGTKELDTLTTSYLSNHYISASIIEQKAFQRILLLDDMALHDWIYHPSIVVSNSQDQVKLAIAFHLNQSDSV